MYQILQAVFSLSVKSTLRCNLTQKGITGGKEKKIRRGEDWDPEKPRQLLGAWEGSEKLFSPAISQTFSFVFHSFI